MRTTVTLGPDVDGLIRNAMRENGISFKEALNSAVRRGLLGNSPRPFAQKSFHMGACRDFRWDKALAVADAIEDEDLSRKLAK